jgi:hypothetical protein
MAACDLWALNGAGSFDRVGVSSKKRTKAIEEVAVEVLAALRARLESWFGPLEGSFGSQ